MKIRDRYNLNKETKVGEQCICPSCNSEFKKQIINKHFAKQKVAQFAKINIGIQ